MKNKHEFLKKASLMAMLLIVTTLFPCVLLAQTSPQAWYENNPSATEFYIGTVYELAYLSTLVNNGIDLFQNKTITLTSDIDLSGFNESDGGWIPIGTYINSNNFTLTFRGTFNGNGYAISNLSINRSAVGQGLFGFIYIGGIVKNLALINVEIIGGQYSAGVAARLYGAIIENTFVTGNISGNTAAGVAAYLNNNALINNCYSFVNLDDSRGQIGGIVGYNYLGEITNSYTIGSLTVGTNTGVGGISGAMGNNSKVSNSIAINDKIYASGNIGRIAGNTAASAILSNNFAWEHTHNINDDYFSGTVNDKNGESKTVEEILNPETWRAFSEEYWLIEAGYPPILKVFLDNENIEQIGIYPEYLFGEPDEILPEQEWYYKSDGTGTYYIKNAAELAFFSHITRTQNDFSGKTIILTADIDFIDFDWNKETSELTKYTIKPSATITAYPYDGNGWIPIGATGASFLGTFDGDGHVIRKLYINRPTTTQFDRIGLFGVATGVIRNLGVIDADVNGMFGTGIIAGIATTIENCFTTGSVSGSYVVGGIVGQSSNVRNSYSIATVTERGGSTEMGCLGAGGVYGCNGGAGTFTNLYATGTLTATGNRGLGIGTLNWSPTTGRGLVSLKQSISSGVSRLVSGDGYEQVMDHNYAWDGVLLNGNIVTNGLHDNRFGADVTAKEIYDGTVWDANHANYPTDVWIIKEGKLPILRVFEEKNDERGGVSVQPSAIPDYIMAEVTPEVPDPEKSVVVSGMNRGFQIGLADEFGAWIHEPVFPDSSEIEFIVGYEEGPFTLWLGIDSVYPAVTVANIQADEMFNVGDYFYDVEIPEGVSNVKINFPSDGMEYVPVAQAGDVIALLKTDAEAWLSFEYNGIQYGDISIALDGSGIFPELGIDPPVTLVSATPSAYVTKLNGNKNDLTVTVTETYSDGTMEAFTKTFSINNNAAGTYDVGGYMVYVDTKGNTQIRECYIVK